VLHAGLSLKFLIKPKDNQPGKYQNSNLDIYNSMEDTEVSDNVLDDDPIPFARVLLHSKFVFDSTKSRDGKHELKIVAFPQWRKKE